MPKVALGIISDFLSAGHMALPAPLQGGAEMGGVGGGGEGWSGRALKVLTGGRVGVGGVRVG